jgi:hypothetical protein
MTTNNFDNIPKGLFLFRAKHESLDGVACLHLRLKINDEPWYNQPHTPVYSEDATKTSCATFWTWAQENLPIYEYPNEIKKA